MVQSSSKCASPVRTTVSTGPLSRGWINHWCTRPPVEKSGGRRPAASKPHCTPAADLGCETATVHTRRRHLLLFVAARFGWASVEFVWVGAPQSSTDRLHLPLPFIIISLTVAVVLCYAVPARYLVLVHIHHRRLLLLLTAWCGGVWAGCPG